MIPHVARICRYPVKGLSGEDLDRVTLTAGRALPDDRRFAIARGSAKIDTANPGWASKDNFVTLLRTDRLAQLRTRYDADTGELEIARGKRTVAKGRITGPTGRTVIDQFLAAFLKDDVQRTPKLVDAGTVALTDEGEPVVSVLNLASVRDLTRVTGKRIDPVRFRANLLVDGLAPWAERQWPGAKIRVGGTMLEIIEPITRCAATDVNPETAQRDTNLPKLLQRGYGQPTMGVYAIVREGATISVNDPVVPPEPPDA